MTKYEYLASKAVMYYGYPLKQCCLCSGKQHPYMVKNTLWKRTIPKRYWDNIVCIPCFEKRLGRHLEQTDFIKWFDRKSGRELPINHVFYGFHYLIYCALPSK